MDEPRQGADLVRCHVCGQDDCRRWWHVDTGRLPTADTVRMDYRDPALPNEAGLRPSDVCRAFRVPPWVALGGKRPSWPVRAWYWLRDYRP